MTALDLLLIILGFMAVIPPAYIYFRNKGRGYRSLTLLSIVAGPLWAISIVLFRNTTDASHAYLYDQFIYTVALLLGIFFYSFEQYFPRTKKHNWILNIVIYAVFLVLLYSIWFSHSFIESVIIEGSNSVVLGPMYIVWMIWMLGIFSFGVINILIDYQKLGKIEKRRLKYFLFAIVLPVIGVIPTNAVLPLFGIYQYIWIGPIAMSLMTAVLAYGISREYSESPSNFYIRIVKGMFLATFIILITYFGIYIFTYHFVYNNPGESIVYFIIFFLLAFLVFYIGKALLEKLIIALFRKSIIDYTKMRDGYLALTAPILKVDDLVSQTAKYLYEVIPVTWVEVMVFERNAIHSRYVMGSRSSNMEYEEQNIEYLLDNLMVLSELELGSISADEIEYILSNEYEKYSSKVLRKLEYIFNKLEQCEASEIVLLKENGNAEGFCLLGYKRGSSSSITLREKQFLVSIVNAFSLGISRGKMHSQLEDVNVLLQHKVDLQTQELRVKIQELQEARQKENDMIDIMGHELRTPATIVKINAQLLDKFDKEIESDPNAYRRYVDRIKIAVENEIKLINKLLSSAKLEGDKITIEQEEVDLLEEIGMAIHGNENDAQDKGLTIIDSVPKDIPHVYADRARVAEILNNLISNAIKYTNEGSVTVSGNFNNFDVEISVADTGVGISKENLSKLGQKFYRVSNYTGVGILNKVDIVRPGGTGLGLFVTFNLIKKMGGTIRVESELGKGSKFVFTLPRYNGQRNDSNSTESDDMFEKLGLKK